MNVALYLLFLTSGIACLLAGLFLTRMTWRTDIAPFGRRSRPFQIALHPENFAKPDRLSAIRLLNLLGAVLILAALCVVGLDVIAAMAKP